LVLEYTTIDERRRRVAIVPDTGGEAWRIEYERRNGEWRETGREPISAVALHLRGHREYEGHKDDPDLPTIGQPAATDGGATGRDAFLAGDAHYCAVCDQPFETLEDVAVHDCRTRPDGDHPDDALDFEAQCKTRQTIARLEKLARAHEQLEWTAVPGVSTAQAATWAQRLHEAGTVLETNLEEVADVSAVIDTDGATTTVRGPYPSVVHDGGDES